MRKTQCDAKIISFRKAINYNKNTTNTLILSQIHTNFLLCMQLTKHNIFYFLFKVTVMKEKASLILIFIILLVVFAFIINSISESIVSDGVNEIELCDAETDMKEIYSLLDSAKIRFKHHVFDWAVFDEAYEYINGNNDKFITRSFCNLKIKEMHLLVLEYTTLKENDLHL